MALEEHSFRHLLPTFLISPGTQVVLKVDKPLPDGTVRQRGSVAVVAESPADNAAPYTLRFADGQTVKAYFRELAIRRKEVEDQLVRTGEDLRPWIIYRCQVGSRAFGLASDDSDDDLRGIYLPPARLHWSLFKLPEQLEFADAGKDEVYWELEKFLKLALKANPNVLETLWTPLVLHADEVGRAAAGPARGVPVPAPVQDLLGLRAEPVPPHGQRLRQDRHVQGQARHAPDPPALLRHRGPAHGRRSASTWPSTATSCWRSSPGRCRSSRPRRGRWSWTASSRKRTGRRRCRSSPTTGGSTSS